MTWEIDRFRYVRQIVLSLVDARQYRYLCGLTVCSELTRIWVYKLIHPWRCSTCRKFVRH